MATVVPLDHARPAPGGTVPGDATRLAPTFRPFGGEPDDLGLDLDRSDRLELVTEVLVRCGRAPNGATPDPAAIWNLTVGQRIAALLTVATGDGDGLAVRLRCPAGGCGQSIEVELSIADLIAAQRAAEQEPMVTLSIEETRLTLRRPTGADQWEWAARSYPDQATAVRDVVRALIEPSLDRLPAALPSAWLNQVGDSLGAIDPLVGFAIDVACPVCGSVARHELDLEALALARLRRRRDQLLLEVHLLASRYHWPEREILALPTSRRTAYLTLIAGEETR
jgi:hypothetical protein